MIVCLCKGVSCSAVRRAIAEGAHDVEAVGRACGAGTDCGACHGQIEAMIAAAADDRSAPRKLPVIAPDRVAPNRAA